MPAGGGNFWTFWRRFCTKNTFPSAFWTRFSRKNASEILKNFPTFLTLIPVRSPQKALIPVRFQGTPHPPGGVHCLNTPTSARVPNGNRALC